MDSETSNFNSEASDEGSRLRRRTVPQNAPVSSLSTRRIVLLGKTGVGKSAVGNTILGQREFESKMRMSSVTSVCSVKRATVSGRSVFVVDTPGFFDTKMKPEDSAKEIATSVYESRPGPHAFLLIFPLNMKFTEEEQQIPQKIELMFGQGVLKYTIILFTHGDLIEDESVEEIIQENSKVRDLVQKCGGRFHVFNNRDINNRDQVNKLLQKIDSMIERNGGGYYSNEMYKDAQKFSFEGFYSKHRHYFVAAAVGALVIAPITAGVAGVAAATGAAAAAAKGFAVGAIGGAIGGAAVKAAAGDDPI